jgi:hypothetical protein
MAFRLYIFLVAALAATCFCAPQSRRPLVQSNQLRRVLLRSALKAHGQKFMGFAAASNGTRAFGTVGHNLTVDYIKTKLDKTGYYNVELQHFVTLYSEGTSNFSALGTNYSTAWFTYGPAGDVTAPVVPVDDLGCEPVSFFSDTVHLGPVANEAGKLSIDCFGWHCLDLSWNLRVRASFPWEITDPGV